MDSSVGEWERQAAWDHLYYSFFPLINSIKFHVCAYFSWERLQASLDRRNDFTWPGESNATCMARGLYFALQTVSKFLLPFLCVIIMVRQEYLVEYQRCKISLSSFAPVTTSVFLFLPFTLVLCSCTCVFSDPAQGFLWEYICCNWCPKGLLVQKMLYGTSPIGSISGLSRKILLIFSSLGPFDWYSWRGWKSWFKFKHHFTLKKTEIVIQQELIDLWTARSYSLPEIY